MNNKNNTRRKLTDIPKENPFRVPEGYFDKLQDKIDKAVAIRQVTPDEKRGFFSLLRPQLALAAGFAGLVLLGYFAVKLILKPEPETSQNDLAEYIEFHMDDFDESQIIDALGEQDPGIPELDYTDDEIIYYLVTEDIDEITIMEELQ
ncbi:MAG TPA: hypothetical protein ENF21_08675 [Bacteroidetes bacterium]|nr:hypothetical protein [Bacteroidota bacterium]